MASASISLAFVITNGIVKILANNRKGKKQTQRNSLLTRSKHNSKEKDISKALTDAEISNVELTLVINDDHNYLRLEESIRPKDSQQSDIERDRLTR